MVIGPNNVTSDQKSVDQNGQEVSLGEFSIPKLAKSSAPYQSSLIGVVSNNWSDFTSAGRSSVPENQNPKPVALVGRVPIKVTLENGPIQKGDYLTTSSTSGVGMKATRAGRVIGMALESFATDGIGEIIVFVNPHFYDPDVYLAGDGSLIIANQGTESDPLFAVQKQEEDGTTSFAERVGAFAKVVAANIQAGLFEGKDIRTDNLSATSSAFLSSNIKDLTVETIRANAIEIASKSVDLIKMEEALASISAKMEILEDLGLLNGSQATNSGELVLFDNLMVSGATTLADAAVLNTFSVGNNLTFSGNSIDTLGTDLEIQPLGQGGVKFLGGAVTISTDGKLKVSEDAEFAKNVSVGGVLSAKDVAVSRADVEILSESEVVASGSSGLVTLPAGQTELKVRNETAKANSAIFITSKTELSQPLYIKQQTDGSFVVGIKEEQLVDVKFNFLVVN
ncbi:MAG: hypothetical protein HY377_01255 [Candidatus Blackburnbacteria bacterium]|nr:hypothetical protein [Candidatus Blackburnbacteria bacterium]